MTHLAIVYADPMTEALALLRTVDGSTLELGYLPGADAFEASIADHPNERIWHGEATDPVNAIAAALDRYCVGHPGSELRECIGCRRTIYTSGAMWRCVTCAPPVSGRGEETR